jgi:putative MATE family efflux protein
MQVQTSYKDILKIATPVIIGSLAMTVLNVTDTAFLGRIGETELGASAIGGVLYFVFAMIGVSIGTGTQIIISRRAGEKKEDSIGTIFDQSLIILLVTSVVLFAILAFGAPPVLRMILSNQELYEAAVAFLKFRSFGIFFVLLGTAFRSFYVGIAKPKVFGYYSFLMAAINIFLGYSMIFGNFGFPKMGIAGAGLASSISELIALIYIWMYTMFKKEYKSYLLLKFKGYSNSLTTKILELSAPIILQNILSMGAWFVFFVFIEKIGQHELAISNVVRGAYMISMTPFWGFSVASNSMISNIIGQDRKEDVLELLKKIIRLTVLVAIVMISINLIFEDQILSIFTSDPKMIKDSVSCFRIVDLALVLFAIAIVSINAVSGTGATKVAMYIEIAAIFIYMLYNYLMTFVFKSSVEVVWYSEIIYWLFTGAACFIYIRSGAWKKLKNI